MVFSFSLCVFVAVWWCAAFCVPCHSHTLHFCLLFFLYLISLRILIFNRIYVSLLPHFFRAHTHLIFCCCISLFSFSICTIKVNFVCRKFCSRAFRSNEMTAFLIIFLFFFFFFVEHVQQLLRIQRHCNLRLTPRSKKKKKKKNSNIWSCSLFVMISQNTSFWYVQEIFFDIEFHICMYVFVCIGRLKYANMFITHGCVQCKLMMWYYYQCFASFQIN